LGRVNSVQTANAGTAGITSTVDYLYDPNGNKKVVTTPGGSTTYDYNGANRLITVHEGTTNPQDQLLQAIPTTTTGNLNRP